MNNSEYEFLSPKKTHEEVLIYNELVESRHLNTIVRDNSVAMYELLR